MADQHSIQHSTNRKGRPAIIRFLEKIRVNPERVYNGTPCWEWQGFVNKEGYGRFLAKFNDRAESYSHRFAYRFFFDTTIPEDKEIDHGCNNRCCANPLHFSLVTHAENQERIRKELCIHGHPYTTRANGQRVCNRCNYLNFKRWRQRHPDQARIMGTRQKRNRRRVLAGYEGDGSQEGNV